MHRSTLSPSSSSAASGCTHFCGTGSWRAVQHLLVSHTSTGSLEAPEENHPAAIHVRTTDAAHVVLYGRKEKGPTNSSGLDRNGLPTIDRANGSKYNHTGEFCSGLSLNLRVISATRSSNFLLLGGWQNHPENYDFRKCHITNGREVSNRKVVFKAIRSILRSPSSGSLRLDDWSLIPSSVLVERKCQFLSNRISKTLTADDQRQVPSLWPPP